jgi:plastocyanin
MVPKRVSLATLAALGIAMSPVLSAGAGAAGTKGAPIKTSTSPGYVPATITVKPGALVYFTNADGAPHNAVALKKVKGKPAFSSGSPTSGSFKFTAPKTPGTYSFQCTVHRFKGKLVVKK